MNEYFKAAAIRLFMCVGVGAFSGMMVGRAMTDFTPTPGELVIPCVAKSLDIKDCFRATAIIASSKEESDKQYVRTAFTDTGTYAGLEIGIASMLFYFASGAYKRRKSATYGCGS